MPPPARGRFITFEGIDGSGKSTTLRHVAQALAGDGVQVWATKEETDGPFGRAVRRAIHDGADTYATTLLFVADRAQHVADIEARLAGGTHVLCDRYLHSTLAYQGVTLAGRVQDAATLLRRLHDPIPLRPDHVVLFDADPERSVARAARRGATTPYEKVRFLAQVAARYRAMAAEAPDTWTVLHAEQPLADLKQEALAQVRAWLAPGAGG